MAYEKQGFADGQKLYAKHLNHIETGIETLENSKVNVDDLPGEIDAALQQAKEDGEFTGDPGVSPTIAVEEITGGHRITITDASGTKSFEILDGVVPDFVETDPTVPAWAKNPTKPEYTADEIEGVRFSYSTAEVRTGNKWIDGKPTYRKTITFSLAASTATSLLVSSSLDTVVAHDGFSKRSSDNAQFPIIFYRGTAATSDILFRSDGMAEVKASWAGLGWVTLEYTKTTDAATG